MKNALLVSLGPAMPSRPRMARRRAFAGTGTRIRRTLRTCCSVVALLALAVWAPRATAYEQYSVNRDATNCAMCHGNFGASGTPNYVSLKDGTAWGTTLMSGHIPWVSSNCLACHQSSGFFPVIIGDSGDPTLSAACAGCHGREQDEGFDVGGPVMHPESMMAAGLRQHHFRKGITLCASCHADADPAAFTPLGENVLPANYGKPNVILLDPCNRPPSTSLVENKFGLTGLDNDGNLLTDTDDPRCKPDNYKCYKIKEAKGLCEGDLTKKCKLDSDCATAGPCLGFKKREGVHLVDQFVEPEVVDVKKPVFICPPVDKLGDPDPIANPETHMKAYAIKRSDGLKHTPQRVLVRNQFGDHIFQTIKAVSLLAPTAKSRTTPVAPLPLSQDDFQCYKIKEIKKVCTGDKTTKCKVNEECSAAGGFCYLGFPKGITEQLQDQFEQESVDVKKPVSLCLPVAKNGQPIIDQIDHLTCYQIKRNDHLKHTKVLNMHLNNVQFGPEVVSTVKEDSLCVHSLKNP